jgi:hypothetical protein
MKLFKISILLYAGIITFSSCGRKISADALVGKHVFMDKWFTDSIELYPNRTFILKLCPIDRKGYEYSGKWRFNSRRNKITYYNIIEKGYADTNRLKNIEWGATITIDKNGSILFSHGREFYKKISD